MQRFNACSAQLSAEKDHPCGLRPLNASFETNTFSFCLEAQHVLV